MQHAACCRALPAVSAAPHGTGVTPRLGLASVVSVSATNTLAALTPRLFANIDNLVGLCPACQHVQGAMLSLKPALYTLAAQGGTPAARCSCCCIDV